MSNNKIVLIIFLCSNFTILINSVEISILFSVLVYSHYVFRKVFRKVYILLKALLIFSKFLSLKTILSFIKMKLLLNCLILGQTNSFMINVDEKYINDNDIDVDFSEFTRTPSNI
jgi:hypothetical protein